MELHDSVVLTDPLYLSEQQWKSSSVSFYYCSNVLSLKPSAQTLVLLCTRLPWAHWWSALSLWEHLTFQNWGGFSSQLRHPAMNCRPAGLLPLRLWRVIVVNFHLPYKCADKGSKRKIKILDKSATTGTNERNTFLFHPHSVKIHGVLISLHW